MFLEVEVDLEQQRQDQQERRVYVLCPILSTKEVNDTEDWMRNNLFQTKVKCKCKTTSCVIL